MKRNFLSALFRGLTAVFAFLFIVLIFFTIVANANAGGINNFLGISASNKNEGSGEIRFKSSYGDLSDENLKKLIADEMAYCTEQLEEGSVLLKNDGALPLAKTERNVTLFGRWSVDIRYRNSNGGGSADPAREINLKKAFNDKGFTINDTMYDAYKASKTERVKEGDETASVGEEAASFYTPALKSTFSSHNDAAIVLLSRWGGEGTDMSRKTVEGVSQLALQPTERAMLQMIKDSGAFSKIIVLVNSVYPIELTWLDELGVNACLWIGNPGYYGLPGVVNVLTGDANPSGKLVDTFAANSLSAPAVQNFGYNAYENGNDLDVDFARNYVVYQEGIYIGYKYYETRYADGVLGQGNATGNAGVYASKNNSWNYADEIDYPFGYGLSYTTFSQTLDSVVYNEADDTFKATVTVENTGTVAGKTPVQLYVQLPYTAGGVEKAAIQLVAYGKTKEIAAGSSDKVEITFNRYLMASYDISAHEGKGGYILDQGTYYFAVGNDSHNALNNVLAAQNATGMFDQFGNPVEGNTGAVKTYELAAKDDTSYRISQYTENEVNNLFDYADVNYYYDTPVVTYLTRSDWQGTFPEKVVLTANAKIKNALNMSKYDITKGKKSLDSVPYEKPANLTLADMWDVPFEDAKWTKFVQQLSIEDLCLLANEYYGNGKLDSINKPPTVTSEGSEGCSQHYLYGDKGIATGYASDTLLAATWNHALQAKYGDFYAEDALYCGVHTVHGPGAGMHRTPFSGRNAEYFSEDSVVSYYCGKEVIEAMSAKGLANNFKHFFLNDQESGRRGVSTFSNEQAIREIYLRAFEGGVTSNSAIAMMTSYNRVGPIYMAADATVQFKLLRGEWGYKGYTMTDYIQSNDYSVTVDALMNGTDQFGGNKRQTEIKQLLLRNKATSGDLMEAMQESAHRILWAYSRTSMMNGLTSNASFEDFTAWWQNALVAIDVVMGVITVGLCGTYVFFHYFKKNREEVQA
ncbi:MAG: glycoside hydrolase family 3 C-terminal domain-containing protein [Clostridia bacterium]|nr:glycoside hydrolase family 3 C-terminal domain-containing protein [Clostridia bacterium]